MALEVKYSPISSVQNKAGQHRKLLLRNPGGAKSTCLYILMSLHLGLRHGLALKRTVLNNGAA